MTIQPKAFTAHIHSPGDVCPLCEQPIAQDIARRIDSRLREQHEDAVAQVRAEMETATRQAVAEARAQAEAAAAASLADIQARLGQAERARAEQAAAAEHAITAARSEAKAQAEAAAMAALADVQARLAQAEQARAGVAAAAEQAVAAARTEARMQAEAAATARMADVQARLAEAERARAELAATAEQAMAAARSEAKAQAEAAAMAALAETQARLAAAEQARAAAAGEVAALKAGQESAVAARIAEMQEGLLRQKEDLQRENEKAILAEKSKVLKLTADLADLQRKLEGKTAHELGEGSEIDLFEQLRSAFETDRIQRVPKGVNGADVIHEVIHNGRTCGKIIYDAKNRDAWQNNFAVKLNADKLAQGADHAILSSNKFPRDKREIHLQDGVIVANPARVSAIVEILRDQLVRLHELRVSNEERGSKTEELYTFITSEHCKQLIAQVETQAGKMLELETKEQEAHRRLWDARKKLINSVQKARSDLSFEIDRIIGTAGNGADDDDLLV
ncbi:MAG TPA: DUF2130 domain-containing protein [Hyphomicrobiaceae bacterium]|nr:DUF2130 domain-containing protein [Hyphomicrobiaceae bacterium]